MGAEEVQDFLLKNDGRKLGDKFLDCHFVLAKNLILLFVFFSDIKKKLS